MAGKYIIRHIAHGKLFEGNWEQLIDALYELPYPRPHLVKMKTVLSVQSIFTYAYQTLSIIKNPVNGRIKQLSNGNF